MREAGLPGELRETRHTRDVFKVDAGEDGSHRAIYDTANVETLRLSLDPCSASRAHRLVTFTADAVCYTICLSRN